MRDDIRRRPTGGRCDRSIAAHPPTRIAVGLHRGFCAAVTDLARPAGLDHIALSGGVFQNRLVLEGVRRWLRGHGQTPLSLRQVPANDGGLSLGQAVIAAALGL